MLPLIQQHIADSIAVKQLLLSNAVETDKIAAVASAIVNAYKAGGKTLLAGNGGSAADAQHIAAEFLSRFYFDRAGLPSIALSTDTSVLTAIGNDYGFERLFARQVEAHGNKGDVFIGISTSGKSLNILKALEAAKNRGLITVGFTGNTGDTMESLCDICIKAPSLATPRIQECHILVGHIICCLVEGQLFGNKETD